MDDENIYIELKESFDQNKLNYIVKHKDEIKEQMRKSCFEDPNYNPFLMAEKYLKKSFNGKIAVKYKQKRGYGRFCCIGGTGLQSLCREIRHTIARDYYQDIDVVNCHPVVLEHLCEKKGFAHNHLSEFIQDRDTYLELLNVPREESKTIYLSLMNGGASAFNKLENKPDFLNRFKEEMEKIHHLFAETNKEEFEKCKADRKSKGKDFNHEASFMNKLLCDFENKILMCMYGYLNTPKDAVLCFDGIMINKSTKVNLTNMEKHIKKNLDISIKLKIKSMNEGFNLTNANIKPFQQYSKSKLKSYEQLKNLIIEQIEDRNHMNDYFASKMFQTMLKHDIKMIDDKWGYMYNYNKSIWELKDSNSLMLGFINDDSLILQALDDVKNSKNDDEKFVNEIINVKNRIQNSVQMKNAFTISKAILLDENFKKTMNRQHDLFPIKNGKCVDLRTGKVIDRTKEHSFTLECPVDYIPANNRTVEDTETLNKFIGQIFMDDPEYIEYKRIKIGSYLSGRCVRDIDINHGCGRNGKSSLINALKIIMGDFMSFIKKDVVVSDPRGFKSSNKGSGHTSHLVPIDGKRLIVTQELEEGDAINAEIVKKIASGDPIEGIRECYGKKTTTMYPFCKLVVSSNHIPKFNAADKAIIDRLCFNPFRSRFLNEEGLKQEKARGLYDDNKYNYYAADNELIQKYNQTGRPINILFSWLVDGCVDFYKNCLISGIKKPKVVSNYIDDKIGENDTIGQWTADCCTVISIEDWNKFSREQKKKYKTKSSELYRCFSEWAKNNGCHAGYNKRVFNKHLVNLYNKKKLNGYDVYERIKIKEHDDMIDRIV